MISGLKEQWRALRESPPGRRFRMRYERRAKQRKTPFSRVAWMALGVVMIAGGIVALPLPGPGTLVIAAGLAVLAQESLVVARLCDRTELAIRKLIKRYARS